MSFKNMFPKNNNPMFTFTAKLSIGFLTILLLFGAVSAFTSLRLEALRAQDEELRQLADRKRDALELRSIVERMDALASGYLLTGNPTLAEQYSASSETLEQLIDAVGAAATTRDQRNWRARLHTVSIEFVNNFKQAEASGNKAAVYKASQVHKTVMFELVQSFFDDYSAAEDAAKSRFSTLIDGTTAVAIGSSAAAVLFAALISAWLIRSLSAGITRLRSAIMRMQEGDLTAQQPPKVNDELGQLALAFSESITAVRNIVLELKRIADLAQVHGSQFHAIAASSKESNTAIVKAMDDIAAGAAIQADRAAEGVEANGELALRLDGISGTAAKLKQMSSDADSAVEVGLQVSSKLDSSAERTGQALNAMAGALRQLQGDSAEISGVLSAIRGLSQQTNLLALNAALEAARAGVHGRSFSVVAEEVRKLSDETEDAARRVAQLLAQLAEGVGAAADALTHTAEQFGDQRDHVAETTASFRQLNAWFAAIRDEIAIISEMVAESRKDQGKLNEMVHVVAHVAQEAAASVQETSSAAAQDASVARVADGARGMKDMSDELHRVLARFKAE